MKLSRFDESDVPWWLLAVMIFLIVVVVYVGVAGWIYRVHHPTMTETQLIFHFWDAMRWRK